MSWRCFQLTFELVSPLHVGYHKVGSVQRTRYYIPARNTIAAYAERLVRTGHRGGSYSDSLAWVRQHLALTYLFICAAEEILNPRYTDDGLGYGTGTLKTHEFESRYVRAHVTTAVEPSAGSAQYESLHEVEFISPYALNGVASPQRTQVKGHVFMDDEAFRILSHDSVATSWLDEIQVGGERRYGFGRLRLVLSTPSEGVLGCTLRSDEARPRS
jgi:hypothetical protein